MSDTKPPNRPIPPPNQKRTEEAKQVTQEHIDDQKALIRMLLKEH
jgi:hypothetical protein